MSHNGRPNQVRTCSRWLTSERIVLSDRPAAERASTNPPNTSISNRSISSGLVAPRISRRSRTTASPTEPPRLQVCRKNSDLIDNDSEGLKFSQKPARPPRRARRPWSRHGESGTPLDELRGYFLETDREQSRHRAPGRLSGQPPFFVVDLFFGVIRLLVGASR